MSIKNDISKNNANSSLFYDHHDNKNTTKCLIEEFKKLFPLDIYNLFFLNLNNYKKSDIENNLLTYKKNSKQFLKSHQMNQLIYLTHLYTEIPKEFNQIYFANQLEYYAQNQIDSLAPFHGWSIIKGEDYFLPIVFLRRPSNGPLSNNINFLTAEQKYVIIAEIIQGVAFIHKKKFIHSNLNPATVYLNEKYQAEICDYIFVPQYQVEKIKINDDENQLIFKFSISNQKVQNTFKNIQYVAPEILNGGEFSSQSDIYSLGLTIFYILSEKEATFSDDGEIEYPTAFPEAFKEMINLCILADPNKRPTAMEMLNKILDENQIAKFISSKISEMTLLLIKNIRMNFQNNFDSKIKINIFHRMISGIEIDDKTRLIISIAEKGDLNSIEKVGDFFHKGENNLLQDDEYAYECYEFAANKGSLHSILQVARFNEEGIGVVTNLIKSLKYYENAIRIMNKNDPESPAIKLKIDEIKTKLSIIILSKIPLNMSDNSIELLFKKFNVKIIEVEKIKNFQTMTIQFSNFEDIEKAKMIIDEYKFKFKYAYLNDIIIHRFMAKHKNFPKINIDQFYPGKDNSSFVLLKEMQFSDFYLTYKKDSEQPFTARVINELDEKSIKSLEEEINIELKLNHPAILRYIGFSENDLIKPNKSIHLQGLTLFTEFILGDLENAIATNSEKLNNTNKLKIIIGIASGLLAMSKNKIVHRDLKTESILLNENFEPIISDLRYQAQPDNNNAANPIYMAPELYNTDLNMHSYEINTYSFGIILYQILAEVKSSNIYPNCKDMKLMELKFNNYIPELPDDLHDVFKCLIKSCWNIIISERLDPQTIYDILIQEFNSSVPLIPNVDKAEVEKYIRKLEFYQEGLKDRNMFDEIRYLMHLLKFNDQIAPYQLYSIFYEGKYVSNNFVKTEMVAQGELGEIHIFENEKKKTKEKFAGKILYVSINNYYEKEAIQILKNLSIALQINHSCICRYLGFFPCGFNEQKRSIIFNEYMKNGSLYDIINKSSVDGWNDTKKLINIYGIALGMSYLHSHDILHQDLNTGNILEDDKFYPKINNCCISKIFNTTQTTSKIVDISPFNAPEIFTENKYTKASEVYSFGIIVYSIITNQNPHQNCSQYQTFSKIIDSDISQSKESIPKAYSNLIERCLSKKPEDRPTFNDILNELRNNQDFLNESIDVKQYNEYIEYTKSFPNNDGLIEPCPELIIKDWLKNKQVDDLFLSENEQYSSSNNEEEDDEEYNDEQDISLPFLDKVNTLKLKNLKQIKFIKQGGFGLVYKVQDKITKTEYVAKVLKMEAKNIFEHKNSRAAVNFVREILCHSQAKHKTITKFIGYNRHYFHQNPKPVIFTEYISKGDLNSILERERIGESIENWNDTQKLIVIYGIAYGMFYLHSIGILFRDLNPSNILLDDSLFPKICDFGLSKNVSEKDYNEELKELIERNHIDNNKSRAFGTPGFIAPEIYINNDYSEASDVYAFSILVYEIITAKNPYDNLSGEQIMYQVAYIKNRPKLVNEIDKNYWKLIERCWKDDPQQRPTFENIVEELGDQKYITRNVDSKTFKNYVDYLQG